MNAAIDNDHIQLCMVLQNLKILQRISIHNRTVCVIPLLNLAHLMGLHEKFSDAVTSCDDCLVGSESKEIFEMGEVPGVGSMGCPGEAIITKMVTLVS